MSCDDLKLEYQKLLLDYQGLQAKYKLLKRLDLDKQRTLKQMSEK